MEIQLYHEINSTHDDNTLQLFCCSPFSMLQNKRIGLTQKRGLGKTVLDKYNWFGSGRTKLYLQRKCLSEHMTMYTHNSFFSPTENRDWQEKKVMDK